MKILVTSGHSRSKYTIALLAELKCYGYNDLECVQVRTIQLKRLKFYIRQFGLNIVLKKFKAHFNIKLGENELFEETAPIKEFLDNRNIYAKTVKQYCQRNKIGFTLVSNLNNFNPQNKKIDLIIYSGGGILKKPFIDIPKIGILNSHSGPLPLIRGMNAIEWSLFNRVRPKTTVHFIDVGIDTGRIIASEEIPYSDNLYKLRGNATVHNVSLLTKVIRYELYKHSIANNSTEIGKKYFVMHSTLKEYLIRKMKDKNFYKSLGR